jgi:hypothetical protein
LEGEHFASVTQALLDLYHARFIKPEVAIKPTESVSEEIECNKGASLSEENKENEGDGKARKG